MSSYNQDLEAARSRVAQGKMNRLGMACLEKVCQEWNVANGQMAKVLEELRHGSTGAFTDEWVSRFPSLFPDEEIDWAVFAENAELTERQQSDLFDLIFAMGCRNRR